jgi:hypothetical protein
MNEFIIQIYKILKNHLLPRHNTAADRELPEDLPQELWTTERVFVRPLRPVPPLAPLYTATAIPFIYSFSGNCAASAPNFNIHMSLSDLYIPRIGPYISSSRKGRPIVGIYNSLTDT